jgi:hypothetical protein
MKKIAFTLYVFGIMIMVPLYVVLELNHGKEKTSEDNLPRDGINLVGRKPLQEIVKVQIKKDQPADNVLPDTYNTIEFYPFTGFKNLF